MIKKLTKHGNSWAVVIEKPVLDLLNINEDTKLRVSTDGKKLTLEPVKETEKPKEPALAAAGAGA